MAGGILQRWCERGKQLRHSGAGSSRRRRRDAETVVETACVSDRSTSVKNRSPCAVRLPAGESSGLRSGAPIRTAQIDRLVVGADHRDHDILRADAAGVVIELHHIGDVQMLAGRQIVEGKIGRGERGVDGAVARARRLHDVIDVEKRHQFGGAERTGQDAGRSRPMPTPPITVAVYPVLVRSTIGEIERDVSRIGRERQRVVGLFGDGRKRCHVDHRLVVGAGDGDLHGLHGRSAVIVGDRDVVGEDQRLVLGEKIEIVIGVAERPFERAGAVVVALDLRGHRRLEMRQRAAGITEPPDNTAECSVAEVVWVSLWSLSLKFIVPDNMCSAVESVVLARFGEAAGPGRRRESRRMIGHGETPACFATRAPPHEGAATRLIGLRNQT